jgi:hypothetical protein
LLDFNKSYAFFDISIRAVYPNFEGQPIVTNVKNIFDVVEPNAWEDNIKMDVQEVGCGAWTGLSWFRIRTGGGLL